MTYEPSPEQIAAGLAAREQHEYTTHRALPTNQSASPSVEVRCICGTLIERNFWEHQMGEVLKAVFNLPTEEKKPAQDLPHSRACGWREHEHGSACSSNCPTCGGMSFKQRLPDQVGW